MLMILAENLSGPSILSWRRTTLEISEMKSSDSRHDEIAILIFLALAFISVLIGPYVWISELESAYSPSLAVAQVSDDLKYWWPFAVSTFIALGMVAHLFSSINRSVVFLLCVVLTISAASIFLTFQATRFLYLLDPPMMYVFVLPIGLFGTWLTCKVVRIFPGDLLKEGDRFWSKALVSAVFFVPQPLCQFGFLFNHHWHLALP